MTNTSSWYAMLIKPEWAPPAWLFGPVWTVLYVAIAITFSTVFFRAIVGKIPRNVSIPFALNLFFNLIFSPIQFGLRNNLLASFDIFLVLGTLVWALISVRHHARWIAWTNVPYLLWVSFATVLQVTITILNW